MRSEYKFAHRGPHPETGQQVLKWASGIGDFIERGIHVPVGSYLESHLLRQQPLLPNFLTDEGEELILDVFFRAATAPAGFYFRLFNDTPVETDGLADLVDEVTGTGYAPIAVARDNTDWPTLALNAGDFRISSASKTFTATGNWTAATYLAVATSSDNTGKLVAARALSATRTLIAGDSLAVSYLLSLS